MLFPRRLAFTLCAVTGMLFGAAGIAEAAPAAGLAQSAPALENTAAPLVAMPGIEKTQYHHGYGHHHGYYGHHGYGWRHHGYGWHHGYRHWGHPYWRHHHRYYR